MALCALAILLGSAVQEEAPLASSRAPLRARAPATTEDWREFFGPPPRPLPLSMEPSPIDTVPLDLRTEDLGVELLQDLEREPVFLPTLSRIALFVPSLIIEGLASLTLPDHLSSGSLRLYDRGTGREDIGWIYTRTLVKREISFLAGLSSGPLVTAGVESGAEEIDPHRFDRLQRKVFFDSFKRSYRERFNIPSLDLDSAINALSTGSWLDTFAAPALFSFFAAKYGVERKFHLGEDVRIELIVEKGTRFYKVATEDHGGRLAAFAVNLFDLPFSAIVSIDAEQSGIGLGFIGIGTDLSAMVETVYNFKDRGRRPE